MEMNAERKLSKFIVGLLIFSGHCKIHQFNEIATACSRMLRELKLF